MYASGVRNVKRTEASKPAPVADTGTAKAAHTSKAEAVQTLIEKLEDKLVGDADVKATVGDYIRLIQFHKELEQDEQRDIEVRWIEPKEETGESEENGKNSGEG